MEHAVGSSRLALNTAAAASKQPDPTRPGNIVAHRCDSDVHKRLVAGLNLTVMPDIVSV